MADVWLRYAFYVTGKCICQAIFSCMAVLNMIYIYCVLLGMYPNKISRSNGMAVKHVCIHRRHFGLRVEILIEFSGTWLKKQSVGLLQTLHIGMYRYNDNV